jgi:hypothetical protein
VQVSEILLEIDKEIARLQQVRSLLAGETPKTRRGRKKSTASDPAPAKKAAKRKLSPEGRKRIAEAMKRRWAERKKQQATKTTK